jgi:hypothetical protein
VRRRKLDDERTKVNTQTQLVRGAVGHGTTALLDEAMALVDLSAQRALSLLAVCARQLATQSRQSLLEVGKTVVLELRAELKEHTRTMMRLAIGAGQRRQTRVNADGTQ